MHNQGIIVTVRTTSGSTLREIGEIVTLPFGTEYYIRIQNANNRRALVSVQIDGIDQLGGDKLVVHGNSSVDLKRSLTNGNQHTGNAFKFIAHTSATEQHRGVRAQDGLIRVTAQLETIGSVIQASPFSMRSASVTRGVGAASASSTSSDGMLSAQPAGFTAPGSRVDQTFHTTASFPVSSTQIELVIKLVGQVAEQEVSAPLLTTSKLTCSSCGATHPSTDAFCSKCGTSLKLY